MCDSTTAPVSGVVLEEELRALRDWKVQALQVLGSYQAQELGKVLGIPLGQQIGPGVLPAVLELKERVAFAERSVANVRAVVADWHPDRAGRILRAIGDVGLDPADEGAVWKPSTGSPVSHAVLGDVVVCGGRVAEGKPTRKRCRNCERKLVERGIR